MPRRDKNIAKDFIKMYHRLSRQDRTNYETYNLCERVHKKRHGRRCFKNYDSFRRSKSHHYKKGQ